MTHADPAGIELLVLDVDGTLTDGSIQIDAAGVESKRYNIKDGLGLRVWQDLGYGVALVTGRSGGSVAARARELGITRVIQGSRDKGSAVRGLLAETRVAPARAAAMGDDWNDLPMLSAVGYPACPSDASAEVRAVAAFVSTRSGGAGAVRELIDHLLSAKGRLGEALDLYRGR